MRYQIDERSSFNAGYGMHSKNWDLSVYYANGTDENGATYQPNKNLGMLQSQHFVLGYDRMITDNIHAKVEVYYQHLNQVPIEENDSSYVTALNSFGGYSNIPLVNKGTGENYGLELTLERYFTNQFFLMVTSSLFNSTYVGGDGVERNTVNNSNYVNNFQFGKEWNLGSSKHVLGFSGKGVWAGGRRDIPILLNESKDAGETVYDSERAYEVRLPDYIRPDFQITYRINGSKASHLIKLDVQKEVNRMNPYRRYYNVETQQIEDAYQVGILPVLSYKVTL